MITFHYKMSYISTLADYLSELFAENITVEDGIFINFNALQISEQSNVLKIQPKYDSLRTEIVLPGEYLLVKYINCKNTATEIIRKWKVLENKGFSLSNIIKTYIKIDSEYRHIIKEYTFTLDALPSWHYLVKLVDLSIGCEEKIHDFDKKLKNILEEPINLAIKVNKKGLKEDIKEFHRSVITGVSELLIIRSLYCLYPGMPELVSKSNERMDIKLNTNFGKVKADIKARIGDFSLKSDKITLDHEAVIPIILTYVAERSDAKKAIQEQGASIVFLDVSYSFYGDIWRKIVSKVNVKGNFSLEYAVDKAVNCAKNDKHSIVFFTETYESRRLLAYTLGYEEALHIGHDYVDEVRNIFNKKARENLTPCELTPYNFIKIINQFTIKVLDSKEIKEIREKVGDSLTREELYQKEKEIMTKVIEDFIGGTE